MYRVISLLIIILITTSLLQAQTKEDESNKAINRAIKEYNQGNPMKAIATLTTAIHLNDKNYLAYYNRGLSKRALKDYNGAIADCNMAIKLNAKDAKSYNVRGMAYLSLNKLKKALSDFDMAISLEADSEEKSFSPYFNKGLALYKSKRYQEAVESYTNSININPTHEQSSQNRGLSLLALGDFDGAIVDFSQALYMNPNNIAHYLNRGSARTSKEDFEGAIEDFNAAINLDPRSDISYYNLGVCYSNIDDIRMACNSFSKADELGNKSAKEALENIGCLTKKEVTDNVISENALVYNENNYLEIRKTSESEIKEYLRANAATLNAIEGIHSANRTTVINNSTKKEEANYAKVAIVRDDENTERDFIMIMLEGKNFTPNTVIGEFNETAYPKVFLAQLYDKDGSKKSFNFTLEGGLLTATKNGVEGNVQVFEEHFFVRIFPKATTTSSSSKPKNTSGKPNSTGTCFALSSDGVFATNEHVIRDASQLTITLEGKPYKAEVLEKDANNDVAIIAIKDPSFKGLAEIPYKISKEPIVVGQEMYAIGYPLTEAMGEKDAKLNLGIVNSKRGPGDDIRYFQISAELQPGNSGGPVIDKFGNIRGVASSRLTGQANNVNYALRMGFVENLMNLTEVKHTLSKTTELEGLSLQEQFEKINPFVGLVKAF